MLNRRVFTTGIAAAVAGAAQALDVDEDDGIRDILWRRIEVEKRSLGMAVCVVTPNRSSPVMHRYHAVPNPRCRGTFNGPRRLSGRRRPMKGIDCGLY
jgi:hypothetical protein